MERWLHDVVSMMPTPSSWSRWPSSTTTSTRGRPRDGRRGAAERTREAPRPVGRDGSSSTGAERTSGGAEAPGERGRARGRPVRVVVAVVLLVCGVGASLAVGAVLERARADRVAAQAGGLWPVASEPASLWRASTGEGLPAAVDGQVVLTGPEGTATARDITTGDELWTAHLPPGATTCGPDLLDPAVHGSPLVCVTDRGASAGAGPRDDGFPFLVTVLDRTGQVVGSRVLSDGAEAATPLAGGRVATAVRGADAVVVTWEGALDGAVERVRTVGVAPAPVDAVGSTGAEETSTADAPVEDVGLVAARGLLHVRSGDVSETFDAAGDPSSGSPARRRADGCRKVAFREARRPGWSTTGGPGRRTAWTSWGRTVGSGSAWTGSRSCLR